MPTPTPAAQRRPRPIPVWARWLGVGLALAAVLAAALALAGVLRSSPAPGGASAAQPATVDFGLPSRAGLKRVGAAPGGFPVTLELGLVADQNAIASAARAGSDPSSSTYGLYPTLPELARRLGAPTARRRAVLDALSAVGARGTVDATGLRVTAPMTIGRMERLFARQWSLYATGSTGTFVALPDRRPRIPERLRGRRRGGGLEPLSK